MGGSLVQVQYSPSLNSCSLCLVHEIISLLKGDLAQLVERRFCTADVSGSSLLISNFGFFNLKVKKIMDYGGYLGMKNEEGRGFLRKIFDELKTSYNSKVPESIEVEKLLL